MSTPNRIQKIGPDNGRLLLFTSRVGLAATAGHDLKIEITHWSGEAVVGERPEDGSIEVTAQLPTLRVIEGTGGVKPLSDRDKREIAQTARKLLDADRRPEARFVSTAIRPSAEGGVIEGTLALRGRERPLALEVSERGEGRYHAVAQVTQSEFGIKPYSAFLGALKIADSVRVEAEIDLSGGT